MKVGELRDFISSLPDDAEVTVEAETWERIVWLRADALALQGGKLIVCATEEKCFVPDTASTGA